MLRTIYCLFFCMMIGSRFHLPISSSQNGSTFKPSLGEFWLKSWLRSMLMVQLMLDECKTSLKTTSNGRSFIKHCIAKLNKNLKTLSSLQMNVCPCFFFAVQKKEGKIRSRLKHSEKESALTELRNELKEIRKLRNSPPTLSLSSYSN